MLSFFEQYSLLRIHNYNGGQESIVQLFFWKFQIFWPTYFQYCLSRLFKKSCDIANKKLVINLGTVSVVPFSCIFVPELLVSASVCCFVLLCFLQESLYTTVYFVSIILFKIKNIESVKPLDWAFIVCTEKKNPLLRTAHSFLRTPPTSWVLSMAQWRTGISLCSRYWKKQVFFSFLN